ncbi:hypothetical protein [Halorubrum sp. PV6]|uniref:hypothetical protein n=1 Tax=Halorubrum sp. PV6 TaxID=634157 RepID=UPI001FCF067F|nr:hypothetical protein [Halorubrum sp. PV6]
MIDNDIHETVGQASRRQFLSALSVAGGVALAGCGSGGDVTPEATSSSGQEGTDADLPEPGERITSARRIGPRDVSDFGFQELWSYRKRQAVETLVSDPRVNEVASNWVASFEAYDPLTNRLDAVSVQGTTGMTVDGGPDNTPFEVTATNRQVAYGLVDRITDELVGLKINEPTDVTWTRGDWNDTQRARHETMLNKEEIWQHLEGKEWYPMVKAAEIITSYGDYAHGEVSNLVYFVMDGGELKAVSGFMDVTGEEPTLLDLHIVNDFAEHPAHRMAQDTATTGETVLGEVPEPPMMQRPQITGPNGFHRIEEPPQEFEQDGWSISWSGPRTVGAEVRADFNGTPVFSLTAPYSTSTCYDMPERNGRNTREWMFPNEEPVISGELIYWDIHSLSLGGPGILGKTEYPSTQSRPGGFNIRTHYHTGAVRNARDFHSGHRFAPYNYYINYQFYEDGVFMPVFQRHGPGYVNEFYEYRERENDGPAQYYLENWLTKPTPGTTDGVETRVFDGDEWQTPGTEFYLGSNDVSEEHIVRFTNPAGPETIDVPLDNMKEVVVVQPKDDEIGQVIRANPENPQPELEFYHPAQYVSGEPIQGREVFFWLLMEAPTDEVPHASGITTYTQLGEFNLSGY